MAVTVAMLALFAGLVWWVHAQVKLERWEDSPQQKAQDDIVAHERYLDGLKRIYDRRTR